MRRLTLTEYSTAPLEGLGHAEAAALAQAIPSLTIEPSHSLRGAFDATPGSVVGAVMLPGLEVQIAPKIGVQRLLFLVSYAVDPSSWSDLVMGFAGADSVPEAIAPAFIKLTARATHRGLLHGYRVEEDWLPGVRGQIRFGDQIRHRYGIVPPVAVRFDDFTPDIPENRLLKTALHQMSRMRLRSVRVLRALREMYAAFDGVSMLDVRRDGIPEPRFSRLNRHYEPAVTLAGLILRGSSFDLGYGAATGTGFLLDMNRVFEAFVYRALMDALRLSPSTFRRGTTSLHLDDAHRIGLEPDLSWWRGAKCVFVGDVKYKRLDDSGFKHGDLYQLLAYIVAANVESGLLVYAASEAGPAVHRVRFLARDLCLASLDLSRSPQDILAAVAELAVEIRNRANLAPDRSFRAPVAPTRSSSN